ncbi:MAG: Flp pilus assembly protein CpaB [Alphaproteobacteria bacterium]|nr:Flp pilus assembly protein CpaB [Alphaproteobacteria bacterium]
MMIRRVAFLLIALVISIGTVLAARSWMQSQLASREPAPVAAAPESPKKMVLVAKTDMPAGTFVRPENLRWQAWPEEGIADNYVVEGQGKLEDFIGAVVRSGLTSGEPIADGRVVRPGDRSFMAAVLTPGNRAVSVTVTPSSGLAGFAFPGDRVDVLLTLTIQPEGADGQKQGPERRVSETVLTDIRILAVDQRADDQKREIAVAKTATLEVTPKQAEIIAVAGEMGKLSLSLRSLAQDAVTDTPPDPNPHTWDADAAPMLVRTAKGGLSRKVSVVRGSDAKDVDFASMATQ